MISDKSCNDKVNIFWLFTSIPSDVRGNISQWRHQYGTRLTFWENIENLDLSIDVSEFLHADFPPALKVDLLRVIAIKQVGGWYCDADTRPGPINLIGKEKILLFREEDSRFCNGIFFAPQNHPFLQYWIDEIKSSIKEYWPTNTYVPEVSGPHALSRALYTYAVEVGVDEMHRHIGCGPWKLVQFRKGVSTKRRRPLVRTQFAVEHFSKGSWERERTSELGYQRLSDLLYSLRQSFLGKYLDWSRNAFLNIHLKPFKNLNGRLIRNMDNRYLDKLSDIGDAYAVVEDLESLAPLLRDLSIGVIVTNNRMIGEKLRFGGWDIYGENKYFRPNVTSLVGT